MVAVRAVILSMLMLCGASVCAAPELGVLMPVMEHDEPLMRRAPESARQVPVVTRVKSGKLFRAIEREARAGFTSVILQLDEDSKRVAGRDVGSPSWLFLATEDGGFARRGFWLRENGAERWVGDAFVDLVVDEESVSDGSFEEIFAHEMGHVFLHRLLPSYPWGMSRARHGAFTVTDDPTAFDEGFAMHFQALARRYTSNRALTDLDQGLLEQPFTPYWQSNRDRAARIAGVRLNWFVQAQLLPPGEGAAAMRQDSSNLFVATQFKDANQMFASEGVLGTIFYRTLVAGGERQDIAPRYRGLFLAFRAMEAAGGLGPDTVLVARLARAMTGVYPALARHFVETVVAVTYGATVDPAFARNTQALAAAGQIGDRPAFIQLLGGQRKALLALQERVAHEPALLQSAIGPALWIAYDAAPATQEQPVVLNLNTAQTAQLSAIPALAALAERLIEARRKDGAFRGIDDLLARAAEPVDAAQLQAILQQMAARASALGVYERE